MAEAARKIAAAAGPEIDAELAEVTGGAVTSVNQVAKLQAWLTQNGCAVKDLQKKTVETLLEDGELPSKVQRALELRQDGAAAAVKKINTLLQRAGDDGRVRGALQFHKASTGRWAGVGFQPQNLKKPQEEDLEAAIAAVATGDYEHVRGLYPKALSLIGDLSRCLIVAAPGHTLIGADFSAIESRVLAWVAGERWKLDAYSRYDATQDPAPTNRTASSRAECCTYRDGTFTPESPERKIGKTADLACGYMGGAGAIEKFAPGVFDEAKREQIKREWRAAHPNVVNFWYEIDRAAWAAVQDRGRIVRCGPVAFRCAGAFLFLKLPSGRKLAYPVARTKQIDPQHGVVLFNDNAAGGWRDCRAGHGGYAGLWCENVVSGIARDLLAEAMQRVEAAGYPIVLHVHDEHCSPKCRKPSAARKNSSAS